MIMQLDESASSEHTKGHRPGFQRETAALADSREESRLMAFSFSSAVCGTTEKQPEWADPQETPARPYTRYWPRSVCASDLLKVYVLMGGKSMLPNESHLLEDSRRKLAMAWIDSTLERALPKGM